MCARYGISIVHLSMGSCKTLLAYVCSDEIKGFKFVAENADIGRIPVTENYAHMASHLSFLC